MAWALHTQEATFPNPPQKAGMTLGFRVFPTKAFDLSLIQLTLCLVLLKKTNNNSIKMHYFLSLYGLCFTICMHHLQF